MSYCRKRKDGLTRVQTWDSLNLVRVKCHYATQPVVGGIINSNSYNHEYGHSLHSQGDCLGLPQEPTLMAIHLEDALHLLIAQPKAAQPKNTGTSFQQLCIHTRFYPPQSSPILTHPMAVCLPNSLGGTELDGREGLGLGWDKESSWYNTGIKSHLKISIFHHTTHGMGWSGICGDSSSHHILSSSHPHLLYPILLPSKLCLGCPL